MADRADEIRALFATFEREGIDAALHAFDPEINWESPPGWMASTGYHGHHGIRELEAVWQESFDEFGLTVEEIHQVGDLWVVLLHQHGRIKGSGDEVKQKVGWVMTYGDNGLIRDLRAYFSWAEALDDARGS